MSKGRELLRILDPLGEPTRPAALTLTEQAEGEKAVGKKDKIRKGKITQGKRAPGGKSSGKAILPSWLELPTMLRALKLVDIYGPTPEQRFTESDQVDPLGRFRFQGTGGSFYFAKALTALWATSQSLMSYDITNKFWLFNALQANDWYIELLAGVASTAGTNAAVFVGGSTASPAGVDIRTGNAGGGSLVSRLKVNIGAGTPDIDITDAWLDMNGLIIYGVEQLRGGGSVALYLRSWRLTTDAVAQRIIMDVLDPATDTVYPVAQGVPNAASPFFSIFAPNAVPTTSILDASNIGFRYTSAGAVTLYVNDGGVIKALSLGTPV